MKMNDADLELEANRISKVVLAESEKITNMVIWGVSDLTTFDQNVSTLLNLTGVVIGVMTDSIGGKRRTTCKIFDHRESKSSIDCMFWDLATILMNDYVYTFTNVLLKNENGKIITKSFATEVSKQEKSSLRIKFDSCINITETSIICQNFLTWADIRTHDIQNVSNDCIV